MKKGKITKLLLGVSVSAFMLSGCTKNVKDEQMSVKVLNESVDGTYTGKVEKKEAEGTGKFILGNKSVVEGKFHEGKFLQGTLTNYDYHFKWVPGKDEKYEFDGKFSGKLKKEKFNGKGIYVSGKEGEKGYFSYTGQWKNGVPDGKGNLQRVNEEGEEYTYDGQWKNGMENGEGIKTYTNKEYPVYAGTYTNGAYTPDLVQWVEMQGSVKDDLEYKVSEPIKKYLKNKEKFFSEKTRKQNKKIIKKAKEFKYKSYAKEPGAFTPKIVKASKLHVVSIGTVDSTYENKNTWVLLADSNYSKYYYVNYSGRVPGVVEESVVDIYFLPVAYTTYKTIDETQNYTVCGQAALIEK